MMIMLRKKGFTLVEIMIVVAIIGLLAAIAIPNFVRARQKAQAEACIANLRQIEGATQVWAVDTGAADTATPTWNDLVPNYIRTQPACPAGGNYTLATVNNRPTCSVGNTVSPAHSLS
ncbi:MAG: prepilin-type N-terminal cleavage/methylation domain-containing protein [Candidatus Omnitrophica bacterium]|nr:prepilin-type N-terminal cleavage/methylation domain-containing protein [Candidatus Omnitrophota bacterium]